MFRITWPSWAMWIAGLWLLIAPFSIGYAAASTAATVDDVIIGILVASLAAWICTADRVMLGHSFALPFLGVWLLAAPFLFDYRRLVEPLTNDVLVGLALVVLGAVQVTIFAREIERA